MRHNSLKALVPVVLAAIAIAVAAAPAAATKYVDNYFGNAAIATGTTGGLFNGPSGVAVNESTGAVYVVDRANNRVQQFDASNDFVRAWGQDVIVGGAPNANGTGFEVCDTTAGNTPANCKQGIASAATGGAMSAPRGVAVNQSTGHVYVTDGGFRRVQEFTATGQFVRAWGGDVVVPGGTGEAFLPGGVDERQTVALSDQIAGVPSGGTFTLTFDGQTTGAIAYNASAATVDAALEALSNIGAGDVSVSGANGGTWTIDFTGALAGTNVPALVGDGAALTNDYFLPGYGVVTVATPIPGGPSGAHEVCSVQSECQTGVNAAFGGAFGTTFVGYPAVVPAGAPNAGNVLVADPANSRVQEFTAAGAFVRAFGFDVDGGSAGTAFEICTNVPTCKAGAAGVAVGQFGANEPRRVAAAASGDIYALDMVANRRVQKFAGSGLAAAPFADGELSNGLFLAGATQSPTDIAVDPATGRIVVARSGDSSIFGACPFSYSSERRILEFSPLAALRDTHLTCAGISFGPAQDGLAVGGSSGRIYTSATGYTEPVTGTKSANRVWVLDDDGITPAIATLNPATDVTAASAALSGTVNPNSVDNDFGPTGWRLQVSSNGSDWSSTSSGTFPVGTSAQSVTGSADGLRPNTLYRVRIVTNKPFGNPDVGSPELTFLTDAVQPEIRTTNTQSVADTSAVVSARINPHSTQTSYRFEWGRDAFDHAAPVPSASIGAGPDFVLVAQQLNGLTPGTTYQYRVVATSATEGTVAGPTRSFKTATVSAAAATAPSGRGYELVSPPDKVGGQGVGSWYQGYGNHAATGVGALSADRFASQAYYGGVLVDGSIALGGDWALGDRTADGWVNKPLMNRRAGYGSEAYRVPQRAGSFTDDLQLTSWTSQSSETLKMFSEQETEFGGQPYYNGGTLRDWTTGKWEFFGPTSDSQNTAEFGSWRGTLLAASGGFAAMAVTSRGLAGAGDPTSASWPDSELMCTGPPVNSCNGSVYVDDIRAGLSDSFPGAGIVSLVNVCTGAGPERTTIPSVDGSGELVAGTCPPVLPGRASRLVSPLGASLPPGAADAISADGSKVFFLSPDPVTTNDPGKAPEECADIGESTICPPQLFVRQRDSDGSVTTRWISRSTVSGQDAGLTKAVTYEGASPDGDKVFFTTASPLTPDDPNGGVPVSGGVTTGAANANSVDLYMYDFPDAPGADPGEGVLTRVSRGPTGDADVNATSLRFASNDRVYFATAAPLPDVGLPGNGTITAAGGNPTQVDMKNLYVYDPAAQPESGWRFVARVPAASPLGVCAATGRDRGSEALGNDGAGLGGGSQPNPGSNCFDGLDNGAFVSFVTDGRLTGDDPDTTSGDVYGYDADADELIRLTASQEGIGGSYLCGPPGSGIRCHGDGGIASALPGLVGQPAVSDDRIAFLESRSRLLPDDHNDVFDVYQWRNGKLSLISSGAPDADDTLYRGNDRTGKNVYLSTRDRLTWQDHDSVLDVYVARVGGGFAEPAPPTVCGVLAGQCQGGGASPVGVDVITPVDAGDGNVPSVARGSLSVRKLSKAQRRRAARIGVLTLDIKTDKPGAIDATARARIGRKTIKVGSARKELASAGTARVGLRLSKAARRALRQGKALKVTVQVTQPGLRGRTATVLLEQGRKS
jgi:hypothetical protein